MYVHQNIFNSNFGRFVVWQVIVGMESLPFNLQPDKVTKSDTNHGHPWLVKNHRSNVISQKILHIPCSRTIFTLQYGQKAYRTYTAFKVDSGYTGRRSKTAANSKSHAVSFMTHTKANGNFHAVLETVPGRQYMA